MHITRFLFTTFAILGLTALPSMACEPADEPGSLEYSLREDNSCEGIRDRVNVSGSLELVSITSTNGGDIGRTLRIRVPRRGSSPPFFVLQKLRNRFMLNAIEFTVDGNFYTHNRSTSRMIESGVRSVDDLVAIAFTGIQRTYLPTFLGQPANNYLFVFYSVDSVQFLDAGIRKGNSNYASWGEQSAREGRKEFEWNNVKNAPAGLYEFYYIAEIEQGNRAPERISRRIAFWHDPNWLR